MPPLVSALVSTYNAEKFMAGCLSDLEMQTLASAGLLEIVVIDSGSEQNERAIVKEFQAQHGNIVYQRTARENTHAAFNRAAQLARGRFLTMANTDDRHHPAALETLAHALLDDPDAVLAYHDSAITTTPNANLYTGPIAGRFRWPDFDPVQLFRVCYVGPQAMWRKSAHERAGGFDLRYEIAGDYELWLRLARIGRFSHVPKLLGCYLWNTGGQQHAHAEQCAIESRRAQAEQWRVAGNAGEPPAPVGAVYLENYSAPNFGPLVSVIVPTYNRPEELLRAVTTVRHQSYRDIEIIVINDGGEPVRGLDGVRVIDIPHGGTGAARNAGLQAARGEYVAFLDDDDLYRTEHIAALVAEILAQPRAVGVYSDGLQVTLDVAGKPAQYSIAYSRDWDDAEIMVGNYIPNCCLLVRTDAARSAGFDASLPALEDWEFIMRLSALGRLVHLPMTTCRYHVKPASRNMMTRADMAALYRRIYDAHPNPRKSVQESRAHVLSILESR